MKTYSLLTEEIEKIGPPSENLDSILGLADLVATGHDNVIVYVEGPVLQKWVSDEGS